MINTGQIPNRYILITNKVTQQYVNAHQMHISFIRNSLAVKYLAAEPLHAFHSISSDISIDQAWTDEKCTKKKKKIQDTADVFLLDLKIFMTR